MAVAINALYHHGARNGIGYLSFDTVRTSSTARVGVQSPADVAFRCSCQTEYYNILTPSI